MEAMISLVILAVGILGVAQMQIFASSQNGFSRRNSRSAVVARDFVESAQRWGWRDPRMQPGVACGAVPANFPLTDDLLGNDRDPLVTADYTATPSSDPHAPLEATTAGALLLANSAYDGAAQTTLANAISNRFQLLWSVNEVDRDGDGTCESRQVSVVVRYPSGIPGRYENLITTFAQYDSTRLRSGGLPEQI